MRAVATDLLRAPLAAAAALAVALAVQPLLALLGLLWR